MNRPRTSSRRAMLVRLAAIGGLGLIGRSVPAAEPRLVEIEARRFQYTPERIVLKRGEPVVLAFRSVDFIHGFSAPELGLRADLLPGQITRVSLQPMVAGSFGFLCDNFCGDGHEAMSGTFVVADDMNAERSP